MREAERSGRGVCRVALGMVGGVVLSVIPMVRAAPLIVSPRPRLTGLPHGPARVHPSHPARLLASRLGHLRSEALLLEAQLTIAKLRREIVETRSHACLGIDALPDSNPGRRSTLPRGHAFMILPVVRSIEGIGGRDRAVVVYPDGSRAVVVAGSRLEDGVRVLRVDGSGVTVDTDHGKERLPFAASSGLMEGSLSRLPTPPTPLAVLPAGPVDPLSNPGGREP